MKILTVEDVVKEFGEVPMEPQDYYPEDENGFNKKQQARMLNWVNNNKMQHTITVSGSPGNLLCLHPHSKQDDLIIFSLIVEVTKQGE